MGKRTPSKSSATTLGSDTRFCAIVGPDELRKREEFDALRRALEEKHGESEVFNYDGNQAALADVLDELRTFSMLQRYKLVVVDSAEEFVKSHREALERYAQNPVDNATLVLRSTLWNRGNLDKMIAKVGGIVRCDPLTAAEAVRWLSARALSHYQRKFDPQGAQALVNRLGCEALRLDTELAKLSLLVNPSEPITAELVVQVVGRSSEENAWQVQELVLESMQARDFRGAAGGAIVKVHELVDVAGQPEVLVAYFVADLIRKLHLGLAMRRQGVSEFQIARDLKLWGERQHSFMTVLRRLDLQTTGTLLGRIVEMDRRAKSGLGDTMRNLECFCAIMAEELK